MGLEMIVKLQEERDTYRIIFCPLCGEILDEFECDYCGPTGWACDACDVAWFDDDWDKTHTALTKLINPYFLPYESRTKFVSFNGHGIQFSPETEAFALKALFERARPECTFEKFGQQLAMAA